MQCVLQIFIQCSMRYSRYLFKNIVFTDFEEMFDLQSIPRYICTNRFCVECSHLHTVYLHMHITFGMYRKQISQQTFCIQYSRCLARSMHFATIHTFAYGICRSILAEYCTTYISRHLMFFVDCCTSVYSYRCFVKASVVAR